MNNSVNSNNDNHVKTHGIMMGFLKAYCTNRKEPVGSWLPHTMHQYLPEKPIEELQGYTEEIICDLNKNEEMNKSLNEHLKNGKSREEWFYNTVKEGASYLSGQQTVDYLNTIDKVINESNSSFAEAMRNNNGAINNNPNLDGIIAEHNHANTYNINAAAKGKPNRAHVNGSNQKNSTDVTLGNRHYQMKYGKNAKETIRMIKKGNYNGQIIVVPEDQVEEVKKAFPNRKVQSTIDDGNAASNGLTKKGAKDIQERVKNGDFDDIYDWNLVKNKDLVTGIAKNAGKAGIMGAAIGTGFEIIRQIKNEEDPDVEKIVKQGLKTGADFGIKASVAGALKVSAEKGLLRHFAKGTPAGVFANIAFVGVENIKTLIKYGEGKLTETETKDKIAETTISTTAAIALSAKGAALGAKLGAVFGPAGAVVGGFVGGTVSYACGSKIGEKAYNGVKKLYNYAKEKVKDAKNKAKETIGRIKERFVRN